MKNPHRQVRLVSNEIEMICNLPEDDHLKVGNQVRLKNWDDPSRWWKIVWVSEHVRDKSQIHVDWNNNI